MNCQILISFLIFCTGYGVQFDHGGWKPMPPQGHPRMPPHPIRQNLERIENQGQQRTHSASPQIKDNVVDRKLVRPSKDQRIVNTPLSKKNQVVKNNGVPPIKDSIAKQQIKSAVATDRAGEFFSRPPPPVTINLRHANGRNAQRSPARPLVQSVRHNINHNTQPQQRNINHNTPPQQRNINHSTQPQQRNSRPLPQHNSRPLPQPNSINVRPQQQHTTSAT